VEVYFHAFLTSALNGGEWLHLRPGRFTLRERASGIHCLEDWMGPRAGLDAVSSSINPVYEWNYDITVTFRKSAEMSEILVRICESEQDGKSTERIFIEHGIDGLQY
jgi:hypothetical protein